MKDEAPGPASHGGALSEPEKGLAAWHELLIELPIYFWESDDAQRFSFVSDGVRRHLGVDPASRIGQPLMQGTRGMNRDGDQFRKHLEILTSRQRYSNFCFEKEVAQDRWSTLMTSGEPRFDQAGSFCGLRGLTFDLSAAIALADRQVRAIEAICAEIDAGKNTPTGQTHQTRSDAQRMLSELLDVMNEGVLVISGEELLDPENHVIIVNRAYRDLFGFSKTDIYPGQPMREIYRLAKSRGDGIDPITFSKTEEQLLNEQSVFLRVPSQEKAYILRVAKRQSGGFVIMHTDVTEIDQKTKEVEKARDAEIRANQAKSDFLAKMSHEIRTPMNGIVGVADLLMKTELTEEQRELVGTIQSSGTALTQLIGDILDFSKIEAGHLVLDREDFGLRALADELKAMFQPMASSKNLTFELYWQPDAPDHVSGDKHRLRQILINLIGNAIKFTTDGYVLTSFFYADGHLRVQISDSGIGISKDQIGHVFSVFHQVEEGFRREFEGTGLGLAITKQLVEGMGGQINVTSRLGQGASFEVSLPLPAVDAPTKSKPDRQSETPNFEGRRMLLAEDNRTNRLVVSRMLKNTGVAIDLVEDGQEACEACEATEYDVVLMDVSMPKMTGLEATEVIRRIEVEQDRMPTRIVALTGNAFSTDRDQCLAAGMDGFLTKPIRLETLHRCLAEQLNTSADASDALWSEIKDSVEKP